jgi:hypothetical protein
MTVRSQLILVCDYFLPGCMGRVELVTADLAGAVAVARRQAADAGWSTERSPDGQVQDICPFCSGVFIYGDAEPRGAPDQLLELPKIPKNIGEAADWARARERAAQAEREARGEDR